MPKPATKSEKAHMDRVAALGCIICGMPACIHHVRKNAENRNHMMILPLCDDHHSNYGVFGVALHAGVNEWEKNFGTQEKWLAIVGYRLLNKEG